VTEHSLLSWCGNICVLRQLDHGVGAGNKDIDRVPLFPKGRRHFTIKTEPISVWESNCTSPSFNMYLST
jgi:hypothetical protein